MNLTDISALNDAQLFLLSTVMHRFSLQWNIYVLRQESAAESARSDP